MEVRYLFVRRQRLLGAGWVNGKPGQATWVSNLRRTSELNFIAGGALLSVRFSSSQSIICWFLCVWNVEPHHEEVEVFFETVVLMVRE